MDEKCASICRIDLSSIKRHKDRWHAPPNQETCKFVPSNALDVQELRKKYVETETLEIEADALQSQLEFRLEEKSLPDKSDVCSVSNVESLSIDDSTKESFHDFLSDSFQDLQEKDIPSSIQTHEFLGEEVDNGRSLNKHKLAPKSQSTLLCYSADHPYVSEDDLTLEKVMDAISNLSIKMDNINKYHASLTELAFKDSEVRISMNKIREANNIIELGDALPLLQWFYDEPTERAVLRCLHCFLLHQEAKPSLGKLTPLQAQKVLNSSGCSTLATGIFLKKDKTQALIKGHNETWYHQKTPVVSICVSLALDQNNTKRQWRSTNNGKSWKKSKSQTHQIFFGQRLLISKWEQLENTWKH